MPDRDTLAISGYGGFGVEVTTYSKNSTVSKHRRSFNSMLNYVKDEVKVKLLHA